MSPLVMAHLLNLHPYDRRSGISRHRYYDLELPSQGLSLITLPTGENPVLSTEETMTFQG